MKRLTRPPVGADQLTKRAYFARLAAHLDEMGVRPGDEFFVTVALPDPVQDAPGGARRSDPGTSKKAAFDAMPRTGSQRHKALTCIARSGSRGLTYAEVQDVTGITGIWKRLSELKQGGWITTQGTRRVAATKSDADVYVLTAKGRAQLADDFALGDSLAGRH